MLVGLAFGAAPAAAAPEAAAPVAQPPCQAKIAIVGGTFINDAMMKSGLLGQPFTIETAVGPSPEIRCGRSGGISFYYVDGHGGGRFVETWAALYKLGVRDAIGGATAGGINPAMKVRDYVVPNDLIDFNIDRPRLLPASIFKEGEVILPRYTPATDPLLDEILASETEKRLKRDKALADIGVHRGGVVLQAAGGRFETPAEIRMFAKLGGDLVTMSVGTEIAYARMVGINYACLVIISNPAEGLGEWKFDGLSAIYQQLNPVSLDILLAALPRIAALEGKPRVGDALRIHPEMKSGK
ncbi:5'-methylthioadenosine phosphorylase [Sphingomonas oleivorans]|uniref:5'-methylthioadenosine phosphorylase n=2 Tax=Sphingomonas oleivorans TaxID=1735121 RepID=A0A2T5G304_9SPHN|nr:5'-methylthioadenosine phosphorylase [Sphingomonas oleivorans]